MGWNVVVGMVTTNKAFEPFDERLHRCTGKETGGANPKRTITM